MRDLFFQAIVCQPPVICGRRLLPFSVSHEYILKALESPYIIGGPVTKADVLLAIDVCAHTWQDNAARLFGGAPPVGLWRRWGRRWLRGKLSTADKSLRRYIEDYTACPEHWSGADGSEIRAPWEFHLVRILMDHCGFSEAAAWDCPLARARCYADTWSESQGDKTLVNAAEQAAIEAAQAEDTHGS